LIRSASAIAGGGMAETIYRPTLHEVEITLAGIVHSQELLPDEYGRRPRRDLISASNDVWQWSCQTPAVDWKRPAKTREGRTLRVRPSRKLEADLFSSVVGHSATIIVERATTQSCAGFGP